MPATVEGSQNANSGPSTGSSHTTPGIYSKEPQSAHHKDPCLLVFTATELWVHPRCLITKDQSRKIWKWMPPKTTMLNELSQSQKNEYHGISRVWVPDCIQIHKHMYVNMKAEAEPSGIYGE